MQQPQQQQPATSQDKLLGSVAQRLAEIVESKFVFRRGAGLSEGTVLSNKGKRNDRVKMGKLDSTGCTARQHGAHERHHRTYNTDEPQERNWECSDDEYPQESDWEQYNEHNWS